MNIGNNGYGTVTFELGQDEEFDVQLGSIADVVVQVSGTFGAGSVGVEGSMDGVVWGPVRANRVVSGAHISLAALTADAIEALLEHPAFIRVKTTDHAMTISATVGGRTI